MFVLLYPKYAVKIIIIIIYQGANRKITREDAIANHSSLQLVVF
jgi:hypothetical protein